MEIWRTGCGASLKNTTFRRAARKEVLDTDRKRARFYEYFTHRKWGDLADFDVLINTSKKTPEEAVDLLVGVFEEKAKAQG